MKKIASISIALALILSLGSCDAIKNSNKTQRGAGIGVAAGAIVGGLIGGNIQGALIGAAIGGAAGGVIGHQMDKQANKISEAVPGAEVKRVGEGIHVVFDDKSGVNFAFDSSELTADAKKNLDAVAEIFTEFPDTRLMIEGYTDSVGNDDYNLKLSERRAKAVAKYLKSHGVANSRFESIKGYGEANPRFPNDTKENQAKNRRVEIGIAANEHMIEDAKAHSN
jgi:outer membrane protein OmpA-like peptidoglycan-associated protein